MAQAAETLLRVSMELGGNAPVPRLRGRRPRRRRRAARCSPRCATWARRAPRPTASTSPTSVAEEFAAKLAEQDGRAQARPRRRRGHRRRPADRRRPARQGGRAGRRRDRPRAPRRSVGGTARRARATSIEPTVLTDVPDDAGCCRRRSSARSRRSRASPTRTRRSRRPTTPSTAWSPTSTPATSSGRCASARRSRPA